MDFKKLPEPDGGYPYRKENVDKVRGAWPVQGKGSSRQLDRDKNWEYTALGHVPGDGARVAGKILQSLLAGKKQ